MKKAQWDFFLKGLVQGTVDMEAVWSFWSHVKSALILFLVISELWVSL